jgi:YHS domain-containing protein
MDKDPVCGMTVSRGEEAGKSEYQGKTYFFCSEGCKERFDRNPQQYTIRNPDPVE